MALLCETSLSRRALLGSAGALFAWNFIPRTVRAAGARDTRFICIILRGALDGLSAVPPIGDPDYVGLRENIALQKAGPGAALPLDGFFGLHPSMPNLARLYQAGQASIVHAVATNYRDRSHFDGQDVLESGQPVPGLLQSGWLNRVVLTLPPGDAIVRRGALGIGAVAPLVVRGPAPVTGWAPQVLPRADEDLANRVIDLYAEREPSLAAALSNGIATDKAASGMDSSGRKRGSPSSPEGMRNIADGAARLIATEDGPRIAALAFEGWDTHAGEGGATGRLANLLEGLDGALAAFEGGLKEHWKDTAIMVVTEFGRTVRVNGTVGTDHGTGTIALLVGGAVKGRRIITDWPGLKPASLLDGRDLRPTADLRAVTKGVLGDLFGISSPTLGRDVFPQTEAIKPMAGLVV